MSTPVFSVAAPTAWLAGFTVCLSLIVSIGAQNLYVLRQAVQRVGRSPHAVRGLLCAGAPRVHSGLTS